MTLLGKKHSLETIEKIRKKALGRKHSEETKEKLRQYPGNWLGKKRPPFSEEWKRKIGENQKHGNLHHNWMGGNHKYWMKKTLLRDDYICQICGLREPEIMEVDHIKPTALFPNLKFDLSNLMTLCPNCHRRKTKKDRKNLIPWNKGLRRAI